MLVPSSSMAQFLNQFQFQNQDALGKLTSGLDMRPWAKGYGVFPVC